MCRHVCRHVCAQECTLLGAGVRFSVRLNIDEATGATSPTDGSLQTDDRLSVVKGIIACAEV